MSLDDQDLSARIRQHATRHTAPDALRAGIRTQIALADAGRAQKTPEAGSRRGWWSLRWPTASVSFAMGLAFAMLVLPLVPRLDLDGPLDAALVGDHVRALQVGRVTEVVSTDRHTVKPWFQGRIDYAPPVFDLAGDGFPLVGGRLEHVRGTVVATLVYARNRHVVDLFVWPSTAQQVPVRTTYRGFSVVHWADGAMQYWAVSDADGEEIDGFARLWKARAAKP